MAKCAVIVTLIILVFSTGCSQSEEAVVEDADQSAESSQTTFTVPETLSQSNNAKEFRGESSSTTTTTSLPDKQALRTENATATLPQSNHIEELQDAKETYETATTIAPSAIPKQYEPTPELSAGIVGLVDIATDLCTDIPGPQCSSAVQNICEEIKVYWEEQQSPEIENSQNFVEEQEAISETRSIVCKAADWAYFYELASVLSAKYGAYYYSGGYFSRIRNLYGSPHNIWLPEEGTILTAFGGEESGGYSVKFNMSEETIQILKSLMDSIRGYYGSEIYTIEIKNENESARVLDQYSADLKNIFCLPAAQAILESETDAEEEIEMCLESRCPAGDKIFELICSPTQLIRYAPGGILQTTIIDKSDIARVEIYFGMMSFVCAKVEIQTSSPEDRCRELAALICKRLSNYHTRLNTRLWRLKQVGCALGRHLMAFPRIKARRACFAAIAELRKSTVASLERSNICSIERQECEAYSSSGDDVDRIVYFGRGDDFDEGECHVLSDYYELETLWKNLPAVCLNTGNEYIEFYESSCYDRIDRVCQFDIAGILQRVPAKFYDRYDAIGSASCRISVPENYKISTPANSYILPILSFQGPSIIVPESEYTSLSRENLIALVVSTNTCSVAAQMPIESQCASALWTSCYDLIDSASNYEHPDSELYITIAFLCEAAYIAELAELGAVLFYSFENIYVSGGFDVYRKFIAAEITRKSIFDLTESGGIYVKPDFTERLSDNALAALKSLGDALAAFVFPYLLSEDNSAVQAAV